MTFDDFESYALGSSPYPNSPGYPDLSNDAIVVNDRAHSGVQSLTFRPGSSYSGPVFDSLVAPFTFGAWVYCTHRGGQPAGLSTPDLLILNTETFSYYQISYVDSNDWPATVDRFTVNQMDFNTAIGAPSDPAGSGWYEFRFEVSLDLIRAVVTSESGAPLLDVSLPGSWAGTWRIAGDVSPNSWWDDIGLAPEPEIDDSGPFARAYFS